MYLVGLTGGIATGKSTVSRKLRVRGIPVIDADEIARQVVEPGKPAYVKIRSTFGETFFDDDNGNVLIREKLADLVFNDSEKRRQLDSIMHPEIIKAMVMKILQELVRGHRFVVLDAPLLFETHMDRFCQKIIVVECDEKTQKARLMARDTLSPDQAASRIASQMPITSKIPLATHVIHNNGPLPDIEKEIDNVLDDLNASWLPFVIRTGGILGITGITLLVAKLVS